MVTITTKQYYRRKRFATNKGLVYNRYELIETNRVIGKCV